MSHYRKFKKKTPGRDRYNKYIGSKVWKTRKAEYFTLHPKLCVICQKGVQVQLHHKTYARLGAEPDSDLVALCRLHHNELHKFHDSRKRSGTQASLLKNSDLFIEIKRRSR